MTTPQVQYFLLAARYLNFTTAAEQLYINPSSLSRQIASIEDELGVKLFNRANNILSLTDAGRELYDRMTVFYQEYRDIVKDVQDISSGNHGHLNLGILEDQYMPDSLTSSVRSLLQESPQCKIGITRRDSRSLFAGLMDGSLDAGLMLVYDNFVEYGFEYLEIVKAPAVIAINRDLPEAARDHASMTINEMQDLLEKIPLAMVTLDQFPETLQSSLTEKMPFQGLRSSSKVKILPDVGSVSLYVAMGLAVTLANRGNLLANDPKITYLPVEGMDYMIQGLVWRRNSQNPQLKKLLATLKKLL